MKISSSQQVNNQETAEHLQVHVSVKNNGQTTVKVSAFKLELLFHHHLFFFYILLQTLSVYVKRLTLRRFVK